MSLVRNEDYVLPVDNAERTDDLAYLDAITWRFIPEAATRYVQPAIRRG